MQIGSTLKKRFHSIHIAVIFKIEILYITMFVITVIQDAFYVVNLSN
jgi:hypothetical protein